MQYRPNRHQLTHRKRRIIMLFHVTMDVNIPVDFDPFRADEFKRIEKERALGLQKAGKWRHLWRIAGRYANVSIFDVENTQELHDIISTLPLFPFMTISVTPLCRHPSALRDDDS
jgi:muconolactone D-isomerase